MPKGIAASGKRQSKLKGTLRERLEQSCVPEPNSGCWLWLSALSDKNYGQLYAPPRNMVGAHIISYELHKGPRNGLHVLHSCDNSYCVNPEHLRLGTHQENMQDREARQRRAPPKGTLNGMAKLTEADVIAIRADPRWPRFIAKDWNTPVSTIRKIKYRATWKHLP